ncbi:MAG: FixJ family two-component response regulator [Gammaproteobacteria bacterium]|jgi:FixJ family two-component response regulator
MLGFHSLPDGEQLTLVGIDDNPADLELMRLTLESIPDWNIRYESISNPLLAAERLKELDAHVLLVDFSMYSLTGIELLENLRLEGNETPAILLTGNGDVALAVSAMHAGFSDYIPKNVISGYTLRRSICNVIAKHRLAMQSEDVKAELRAVLAHLQVKGGDNSSINHPLAHELMTPLTAVREFISIIKDEIKGPINADQRDLLRSAQRSCDQLHHCIKDHLDSTI